MLRAFEILGTSAAYTAELQALVANIRLAAPAAHLVDVNNADFQLDLTDTLQVVGADPAHFADPILWIGVPANSQAGQPGTGFSHVQITDQLRLLPPYPVLQIAGNRGRSDTSFEERDFRSWEYMVDCAVITSQDFPELAQREAIVLISAFERLLRRNETLGGLVELVRADGPPAPGGARSVAGAGVLGAAMVRFNVRVLS